MSPALRTTTHLFFQETLSFRPFHLNSLVLLLPLLFLSAAHAVWFQTPITHKYHVVGVGFGRIASAIQDSVSGGKVPCNMAFFAAIRRANVSLMPLLYKTEVRAEGKQGCEQRLDGRYEPLPTVYRCGSRRGRTQEQTG